MNVKEAKALLGMSDLYGTIRGRAIYLEVKRGALEARSKSGTVVRQRLFLAKHAARGAFCAFIYPENEAEIFAELAKIALLPDGFMPIVFD